MASTSVQEPAIPASIKQSSSRDNTGLENNHTSINAESDTITGSFDEDHGSPAVAPTSHPQTPAAIQKLLDHDMIRPAYSVFKRLMHGSDAERQSLAALPAHCFAKLIGAVIWNVNAITGSKSYHSRTAIAENIFNLMRELGITPTAIALGHMVDVMARQGKVSEMELLLDEMRRRHIPLDTFNMLSSQMRAYIITRQESKALTYFKQLHDSHPTIKAFNELINCYSYVRDEQGMLNALQVMRETGTNPDSVTFAIFIRFYSQIMPDNSKIRRMLDELRADGLPIGTPIWNVLIRTANDSGNHAEALDYMSEMRLNQCPFNKDTHEQMLVALAGIGDVNAAWRKFANIIPNRRPSRCIAMAMAKMVGPINPTNTVPLAAANRGIHIAKLQRYETLQSLMYGYSLLGDVVSYRMLLHECERIKGQCLPVSRIYTLKAYSQAGDLDGAIQYIDSEITPAGISLDLSHYYTLLAAALTLDPAKYAAVIHELDERMKKAFPDLWTDDSLAISRASINTSEGAWTKMANPVEPDTLDASLE
eukprot:jgi/Hompol1/4146/HPOL_003493-RA